MAHPTAPTLNAPKGLALRRFRGEALRITAPDGRTLDVYVAHIRQNHTVLVIDAPADYAIARHELLPPPAVLPPAASA